MLPYFTKDNLDLLYTDTDSLCYHIKNKYPFEFMLNNKDLFDLSNYDKDHPLYDETITKDYRKSTHTLTYSHFRSNRPK